MKIARVTPIAHSAPVVGMRGTKPNYVYVKVETDTGLHGWGEATCGTLATVTMLEEFGEVLIGRDPFAIEENWQRLFHYSHNIRGDVVQMAAISALDMALWDIKGKALGVPVYELLGGKVRDSIWCYGRFDGATPELAVERALAEVKSGLTALKGDPFVQRGPFMSAEAEARARAIVLAVRDAVGPDVELLIEAHGRLTREGAVRFANSVESARPMFFEEPLAQDDLDGYSYVSERTQVPLAAGERLYTKWGVTDLLQRRAVMVLQPDIAHAGGIHEVRKIAAIAEAYHTWLQPHNPYGPVNAMAAMQLNTTLPNFLIMEGGLTDWFADVVIGDFPQQADGSFPVPTGPGLGIDLREDVLKELPPMPREGPSGFLAGLAMESPQHIDWT